jgi:hypothetical protein
MDLLDFDGRTQSVVETSSSVPTLRTANSSASYPLEELLSFDSAAVESQPDLLDTMKDLRIGASSSYTSVQSAPEISGNPFDVFDSSSSVLGVEPATKIITSGIIPLSQPQTALSFPSAAVNPSPPLVHLQQVQQASRLINQSVAPQGPSFVTPPQVPAKFDPYQRHVIEPSSGTPPSNNTVPVFQQQQQTSYNNIMQPPHSTQQAAVSMMVAHQQRFIQVRSVKDAGHHQLQQHLPSATFTQEQQCRQLQGSSNLPPYLPQPGHQASLQQPSVVSGSVSYHGAGNMQVPSLNYQQQQLSPSNPDNSNFQRQLLGPNSTQQRTEQYKSHIQFDPFASK